VAGLFTIFSFALLRVGGVAPDIFHSV